MDEKKTKPGDGKKPLSFQGLEFNEVVEDLLKVEPQPKKKRGKKQPAKDKPTK